MEFIVWEKYSKVKTESKFEAETSPRLERIPI